MMQFIIAILAMALNLAVLFFVVRYATRSSEQVELLRQILANAKPEVKSEIVKLTEERIQKRREEIRKDLEKGARISDHRFEI